LDDFDNILKRCIEGSGLLNASQIQQIVQQAATDKTTLEKTILNHELLTREAIGRCLSDITQIPYRPLAQLTPSEGVRALFSPRCAFRWRILPLDYDAARHVLTVVIHDPAQVPFIQNLYRLLLQPYGFMFLIAGVTEIEDALETHFRSGQKRTTSTSPSSTRKKTTQPRALMQLSGLRGTGEEASAGSSPSVDSSGRKLGNVAMMRRDFKLDYSEGSSLRRAYVSAVALMVTAHLGERHDLLTETRERVRYCQLLSSRLNMSAELVDKSSLAAWLFALSTRKDILKQLVCPYDVDTLLNAGDKPTEPYQILTLVQAYLDMKHTAPDQSRDVGMTRRNLRLRWPGPSEDEDRMLETFLQILMDEEFLSKMGQAAGTILVVDPAEITSSTIAAPLMRDGYDVRIVPSAEAANYFLSDSVPDLIISEYDLPQENGIKFCGRMKHDERTASIPFIMLLSETNSKRGAECLRAGADDFFLKPVDLEIVFLKIQKTIKATTDAERVAGVSGSLADMSFTDMIQILCASDRSMEVVLRSGAHEGHVLVENGNIVHASLDDITGEEAFYRLMLWRDGDFETQQCREFPMRTMRASAMSLLMEGSRVADEGITPGS
jgi:CheY-like chemotaxis protein